MNTALRKNEIILGAGYGLFQFFVLPSLAQLVNHLLPMPLWALQFAVFVVNFICTVIIFRHFLISSCKDFFRSPGKVFAYFAMGLGIYNGGTSLISFLILAIRPDFMNLNNESITMLAEESGIWIMVGAVLLVPVVEECLFRGILFRSIHGRFPVLAWILSVSLFSVVHLLSYIGLYDWLGLLLAFFQYLPAGFALCLAYRKSGTIIAPILMHSTINLLSMLVLQLSK